MQQYITFAHQQRNKTKTFIIPPKHQTTIDAKLKKFVYISVIVLHNIVSRIVSK